MRLPETTVKNLLTLARWIDALNDRFATLATWAVLAACLISAANAVVRYGFDYSSNAYLEIQWYLFAACVMFGTAQVLRTQVAEQILGRKLPQTREGWLRLIAEEGAAGREAA